MKIAGILCCACVNYSMLGPVAVVRPVFFISSLMPGERTAPERLHPALRRQPLQVCPSLGMAKANSKEDAKTHRSPWPFWSKLKNSARRLSALQ